MYQYEKNHIKINNKCYDFKFDIRAVIEYKGVCESFSVNRDLKGLL
jgi:hypothetical protein